MAAGAVLEAVSCSEVSGDVIACFVDEFWADLQPEINSMTIEKTRKDFKNRIKKKSALPMKSTPCI